MITSTSLQHPRLQWEILACTMQAVEQSFKTSFGCGWSDINNKKGEVLLLVRHTRDKNKTSLKYYDSKLNDVTGIVLKALRKHG